MPGDWEPTILFQPVVDLMTGRVVGYEALGRVRGAESLGFARLDQLSREAGRYDSTLQELQRQAFQAGAFRPPGTLLFVNTSRVLLRYLLQQGLGPARAFDGLVFEVPESDRQIQQWAELLSEFRQARVQVAIDDWGMGQAAPLRAAQLKPDWVKIDIAITQKVGQDPAIDRLVSLLVNEMADSHCRVLAEGVETAAQIIQLRRLGVRFGQGFFLANPSREFPTSVRVPSPGLRMGQISSLPLALVEADNLSDQHLETIDKNRCALDPILDAAIADLAGWIQQTQIAANLDGVSSHVHFTELLRAHLKALTRGYIGGEDLERAEAIVAAQRRSNIDLAWVVLGYRRLDQQVRERVQDWAQPELQEALSELFLWDMGLIVSAYQRSLDYDDTTRVLRRRTFWDRASFDATFRLQRSQGAVLVVIQLDGLESLRRGASPLDLQILMEQVGLLLASYRSARTLVGRLSGDEFGVWTDRIDDVDLVRLMRHMRAALRRLSPTLNAFFATAALGPQGTTLEALYAHAHTEIGQALRD